MGSGCPLLGARALLAALLGLSASGAFFASIVGLSGTALVQTVGFDGIVSTACGAVQGLPVPQVPDVWAFRGLRYAAPPIGKLRWLPPKPAACSPQSNIVANQNGQACTQKNPIVDITGVSNPIMAVRVVGCVLLSFATVLSCYTWSLRRHSAIVVPESSGTEKLLGGTVAATTRNTLFLLCLCSFAAFTGGMWLLHFSITHRRYLGSVLGGEDCLFLNIYVHASALASISAPLPVLFFVHGGDLTLGAGTDNGPGAIYGGSWALAATGRAVAVQMNYRLNAFGFLYLEDERGESVLGNSTNLGLLDQMSALHWVRDHISEFGGNPNLVTIYGQSSGGTSIAALLAAPLARGLFHRAFSMSASPRIDATPAQAALAWRKFFLPALPECANEWDAPELRRCLLALPAEKIVGAMPPKYSDPDWMSTLPLSKSSGPVIYMVVVDGSLVLGNVSEVLAREDGSLPGVPTVFGSVREECDLDLKQVRSQTIFDNAAWPFAQQEVVQWGVELAGDIQFGRKVWSLYEPRIVPGASFSSDPDASDSPIRERWSQLTSDIRSICGNIYNAKQLARGQHAPVYTYLFTHRPQSPVTSHLAGWPAWIDQDSSQYAFHMWDIILLFNRTAGFHSKDRQLSYVFTPLDFDVADRFRSAVLEFAETGRIAEWTAVEPDATSVCRIDSGTTCEMHLKKEECALFDAYGVSYGNWIVN